MTTPQVVPELDELYEEHRERLYRAMVVATNDRDLSLEGVDRGFARLARRARRSAYPEADVLRRAAGYAAKRSGADSIRGFRLPDTAIAPDAEAAVTAVRGLEPDRRLALIASLYLGWDDRAVAEATGIADPARAVSDTLAALADQLGLDRRDAAERVAAGLTASAASVSRPLSRLESVKTEGRTHHIAVAAAAAAVVLLTVGGVATGVSMLRSEAADEPQVVATGSQGTASGTGSGETPSSTAAPLAEIGEVTWVQSGLPFREGDLTAATAGPDGFIAIGQDYRDPTGNGTRLLISESGYDWTVLDSPIPRNGWVHSIMYDGGRYVAVGSSFDEAVGRESPVILISEDANGWETLTVPIEPSIEIDGVSLRVYTSVNTASVQGDELIVFGTQHAEEDIFSLFAGNLPEDVANIQNWGISPGGIDFYTNQGELIRTVPAEELGVSPEVFALMSSGRSVAWKSSDGGVTWEESALLSNGFGPESYLAQLTTRGDASVALVYGRFGAELWSDAGDEWAPVDMGRGVVATGLASFGDGFVATGADEGGAAVWRSDDGVVWHAVESDSFADLSIERISATPHGLLAVAQVGRSNVIGPAIVETDEGFVVEIDSTGRHAVTDSEGTLVLEIFGNEVQYGPQGGIVLADPETGETIVTLDQRQIDAAWEIVYRELEGRGEFGNNPAWALIVSRDGDTWTRIDAEEFGEGFYPNVAVLGADRMLVTGWMETGIESGLRIWVGEFGEA